MTTASWFQKTGSAFAVALLALWVCCLFAFPVGAAENQSKLDSNKVQTLMSGYGPGADVPTNTDTNTTRTGHTHPSAPPPQRVTTTPSGKSNGGRRK